MLRKLFVFIVLQNSGTTLEAPVGFEALLPLLDIFATHMKSVGMARSSNRRESGEFFETEGGAELGKLAKVSARRHMSTVTEKYNLKIITEKWSKRNQPWPGVDQLSP